MRLRTTLLRWVVIPYFILFAVAEQKNITAESGQDVTLTCQVRDNNIIDVVEWNRTDLTDKLVFVNRTGKHVSDEQHPSFKNRVELQDREMKDGNVSIILKDVTINDTGTYECRVMTKKENNMKFISSITLSVVDPPGQTGGHTEGGGKEGGGKEDGGDTKDGSVGLKVGLPVAAAAAAAAVAVVVVGVLIYRKCK